eukprot:gnl/TRDRNA2_/TRDRNA2_170923_c2_seq15.p1 gnl/TRDRNA2_/TRDRNA2_170923_c2~~gnl/TRDRNA2_/TRDRNA2_170923_c2_seq15.p1  ORF type:complete len:445 (+),score=101.96 gnl/TRDRNA2_/TRDRNA2_170923_c2_seq15:65-1336(+)
MKIAAVLVAVASAHLSPSNVADTTPDDLTNEVDSLLDSVQLAFATSHELRASGRLRGKEDSKHVTMTVSDKEADSQKHLNDAIIKLKKITATCQGHKSKPNENLELIHRDLQKAQMRSLDLEAKLNLTRQGLLEAQSHRSTLEAQLERAVGREQGFHQQVQQLQGKVKYLSNEITADKYSIGNLTEEKATQNLNVRQLELRLKKTSNAERTIDDLTSTNAEQLQSIQQLKRTINETSRALNASHADEERMEQQVANLTHLLQQGSKENEIEHTNRIRAEQNASKLLKEEQGLEFQLIGARSNSTHLNSELAAEHQTILKDEAAQHTCSKDLEHTTKSLGDTTRKLAETHKELDSTVKALAEARTEAHNQLLAGQKKTQEAIAQLSSEQKKSQEALQQMKATYEKEMARLKAESQKGWMSKMMG